MKFDIISGPWLGLAFGSCLMACQGTDLTLPADGMPSNLKVISGDGQRGKVKSQLPESLVVQVTDGAARPLGRVALRFQADVPSAQFQPAEVSTNESGYAAVRVRLGATEGTQTVEAQLADAAGLRAIFSLTAVADPPPVDDGSGNRGGGTDPGQGGGGGGRAGDDHGQGHDGNPGQGHEHGPGHGHGTGQGEGHGDGHDGDSGDD